MLLAAALLAWSLLAVACGPPPFVVHVTWPKDVSVSPGDPVVYEGVTVGRVREVSLRQDAPTEAAAVTVTLEIDDPKVQLRSADRFHQDTLRGLPVVEVEPARRPSPPLADGSTVAGVPPMMTLIEAQISEAIESLGKAAIDAIDQAIESLESGTGEGESPPEPEPGAQDDAARPNPPPAG